MEEALSRSAAWASDAPAGNLAIRPIAGGIGWSVGEYVCRAGPGDRPFEERHDAVSISAVIEGSFNYASSSGRGLLHTGALLLGNHGACYQCGHDHGTGDRCISVQFSPNYFAEIAATVAGSSEFRFPVAMLPAHREILAPTAILETISMGGDPLRVEEHLVRFVAAAIQVLSGGSPAPVRSSALDERRIGRVLQYLERHREEALDLDRLAGVAAMSKFHFLRVFKRVTGVTPHQFLLGTRLRRAAVRLLTSPDAISKIAYESGFGDLSTFNGAFRARFCQTPAAFRRTGAPVRAR